MTPRVKPSALTGLSRWLLLAAVLAWLSGCGLGAAVKDYMPTFMDSGQDTSLHKRVTVVPFSSGIKELQPRAQAVGQAVTQALGRQSGLTLVDAAQLEASINRVDPNLRDFNQVVIAAGRELGLTVALAGNLTDLSVQYRLKGIYGFRDNTPFLTLEAQLRVLDVGAGTVFVQQAFKREAIIDDIMAESIAQGAQPDPKLVDKLQTEITDDLQKWAVSQINAVAWTGRVLEVEGGRVKINLGKDAGLGVGTVLSVYALGERITTGSGQQMILPGPLAGRLRVVELGAGFSWAEPLEAKDLKNAFEPGQTIRTR